MMDEWWPNLQVESMNNLQNNEEPRLRIQGTSWKALRLRKAWSR
jgi:hypothetical protein